jgi:hypothetical protein
LQRTLGVVVPGLGVVFASVVSNGVRHIRLGCYAWVDCVGTVDVATLSVELCRVVWHPKPNSYKLENLTCSPG